MTDLELQSQETEALLKTSERPKKRALAVQIIALCGAAALAGAALASRAGANDVVVTGLARKGTDNRHVACPQMWCDAPAVLDRLQYVMVQLTDKHKRSNFKFSKSFFVAIFALYDVGRGIPLYDHKYGISIECVFPDIYIQMSDEERKRFAGHALRIFQGLLEDHDLAKTASRSYDVSARLVALARFLLSEFIPKPRRSISTQTDAD